MPLLLNSCCECLQGSGATNAPGKETHDKALSTEETRTRLYAELSLEDPYNGEMVIKNVDKPFIFEDESSVIESWKIT